MPALALLGAQLENNRRLLRGSPHATVSGGSGEYAPRGWSRAFVGLWGGAETHTECCSNLLVLRKGRKRGPQPNFEQRHISSEPRTNYGTTRTNRTRGYPNQRFILLTIVLWFGGATYGL